MITLYPPQELIPAEPAIIETLRSRLMDNFEDTPARMLFVWRMHCHLVEIHGTLGAFEALRAELAGDCSREARRKMGEALAWLQAAAKWCEDARVELMAEAERLEDTSLEELSRAGHILSGEMEPEDFARMDIAMQLPVLPE